MKKMTLIVGAIGSALAAAIAAQAAAKNLVPNPRGQEGDASFHRIELFDCSPCSRGGPCPKVCATAQPPKPSSGGKNTHGCACLHNEIERPINFRYHWGTGNWTNVTMKPGWQHSFCWKYADGSHSSPDLQFELDVDMTKGHSWTTYDIGRVQTSGDACSVVPAGAHYTVKYRSNTGNQFIAVFKRE
jgi:hypothetical protein